MGHLKMYRTRKVTGKLISLTSIRRLTRQTTLVDDLLTTKEETEDTLTETCKTIRDTHKLATN